MLISPVAKEINEAYDIEFAPLKGYIQLKDKPEFSFSSWMDGSFQHQYDQYLEDHIGFRNLLVRLYNQTDFSLYRVGHAGGVIIGKEDYLYELNYILAFTGKDFLGEDSISKRCEKIKVVQDELRKLNTELIIALAPGKGSFYPEYIPDRFLKDPIGMTNNEAYQKYFDENKIDYLDFNSLFSVMRDTTSYRLYPKCGIHWSIYGAYFALDSIMKSMEDRTGIDMVDLSIEGIEIAETPRFTDYDIGDALNLIFRIPDDPLPYPYGYKTTSEGKVKPNLMVIADSYYWTIFNLPPSLELWNEHDFRYYNQILYRHGKPESVPTALTVEEMAKFDFILVLYTEANMYKFANDFFESAYINLFDQKKIEELKQKILNSPEWLAQIEKKAEQRGISLEEMIHLDAVWMLKNNELDTEAKPSENN